MNPLLIKALILGFGGCTGIGGMYFSYPHISNLIFPEEEITTKAVKATTVSDSGETSGTGNQNQGGVGNENTNDSSTRSDSSEGSNQQ